MPRSSSFSNITDQVVDLLRDGMLAGRWRGTLPGRDQLAGDLGVSHTTMEAAMRRLAKEGMLVSQGSGKRRQIVLPEGEHLPRHFRVRFLAYESVDRSAPHVIDLLDRLNRNGFTAKLAAKTILDLDMDAKRIARFVQSVPADAWIVAAGSREVLQWFCDQPVACLRIFRRKVRPAYRRVRRHQGQPARHPAPHTTGSPANHPARQAV